MSAFYDQASLVVVPSGYKSGKIYAQKPLTTDGQLTFTRASTATRVNASGLIETVASGVPRLDYTGSTCPKLLLEPQRTNLFTYSQELDNAAWAKYNLSVTANATTAPDGTNSADKIFCNVTGSAVPLINQQPNYPNTTSTVSGYFKKAEYNFVVIHAFGIAGTVFNLNTGVVVSGTGTITAAGNGWYRCTALLSIGSNTQTFFTPSVDGSVGYTGTSGSGIFAWGVQAEESVSYATSYIPTTSAAVTRLAEGPINLGGAQTLNNFTLFFDGLLLQNSDNMLFGSGSSAWYMDIDASNGRVVLDLASGRKYSAFSSLTSGQYFKLAMKRTAGVVEAFVNGVKLTPSTQVTDTTALSLSSIFWGFSSSYYPKMKVNQTLAFQTALTDTQLTELTTL